MIEALDEAILRKLHSLACSRLPFRDVSQLQLTKPVQPVKVLCKTKTPKDLVQVMHFRASVPSSWLRGRSYFFRIIF